LDSFDLTPSFSYLNYPTFVPGCKRKIGKFERYFERAKRGLSPAFSQEQAAINLQKDRSCATVKLRKTANWHKCTPCQKTPPKIAVFDSDRGGKKQLTVARQPALFLDLR
jgi:hypothetical protein